MLTNIDKENLQKALDKSLEVVRDTISWVEARGWEETQEYKIFLSKLNEFSTKDHFIINSIHMD